MSEPVSFVAAKAGQQNWNEGFKTLNTKAALQMIYEEGNALNKFVRPQS